MIEQTGYDGLYMNTWQEGWKDGNNKATIKIQQEYLSGMAYYSTAPRQKPPQLMGLKAT